MDYQFNQPAHRETGSYADNSLLTPRHFYQTGFEDTLEEIVKDIQAAPAQGYLDGMLGDKKRTLKAVVKSLFNEIQSREQLSTILLGKINEEILNSHTYLHEIRDLTSRSYSMDLALNLGRRRTQLEDRIIGLEKQKQEESLTCWRDLMQIRRYLLTSLKDYWEFARKTVHLGYGEHVEG